MFYGRIPSGQTTYVGYPYTATFPSTTLGFIALGNPACQQNVSDLAGTQITVNVTANPAVACTLGTSDAIDFGTHSRIGDNLDATGAVRVNCPVNVSWTLHFDGGQNALGTQRRMRNANGTYIPYLLYSDAGRTQQIAINGTIPGTGTGLLAQISIYGRIQPLQPPEIGSYADSIVVILSF